MKKIAVINYSGNVGKTTLARHLLAPRLKPAGVIIPVESINGDEAEKDTQIRAKKFEQILEMIFSTDSAIADVGASNAEEFFNQLKLFPGSADDFDLFVLPVTPAEKTQRDTIATIGALIDAGVTVEKIRVVFNQLDRDDDVDVVFASTIRWIEKLNIISNVAVPIFKNEIFERLKIGGESIREIAESSDPKLKLSKAKAQAEKIDIARQVALRRLALGVLPQLDAAFQALSLALTQTK